MLYLGKILIFLLPHYLLSPLQLSLSLPTGRIHHHCFLTTTTADLTSLPWGNY
jgi:hypothetical protein